MASIRTRIHWVDWKTNFDVDSLGRDIAELSNGTVHLYEVATGGEDTVFVLADGELTQEQADEAFHADADGCPDDLIRERPSPNVGLGRSLCVYGVRVSVRPTVRVQK